MKESVDKKEKKLPTYFKKNLWVLTKAIGEEKITEQGIKKIKEKLINIL
jgi:hypothetical protein